MSDHVLSDRRWHVMKITLSKPKVNATDHEMSKTVADALITNIDQDDQPHNSLKTALAGG
jgi:enoyl-CoA hydratase/carnithine racemase